MNAEAHLKLTKAEFLAFAQANDDKRYEFVKGQIVQQMTGGTKGHASIAQNFIFALKRQISSTWSVLQDRGVETPDTIRYPDVVVEPADEPMQSLSTRRPILVVEILSPSSKTRDLKEKPIEYMELATLAAYIVASQDEPLCLVWTRGPDQTFPSAPITIKGRQSVITIEGLGVSLSLDEIYRGLDVMPNAPQG
jgi:Uma2 family endonuclease